jgi:hypothetical protein
MNQSRALNGDGIGAPKSGDVDPIPRGIAIMSAGKRRRAAEEQILV